jgi:hypothetical protein
LCRRWKRGTERNALGRSRGGFSTKINARTNAEGLPIGIEITPGQTHDVTAYPALMDDIDCDPEQMLGDKGYDSKAVRQDVEQRGGAAVIPSLASRKIQHAVDKAVYLGADAIAAAYGGAAFSRLPLLPGTVKCPGRAPLPRGADSLTRLHDSSPGGEHCHRTHFDGVSSTVGRPYGEVNLMAPAPTVSPLRLSAPP